MPLSAPPLDAATTIGGYLLVLSLVVPLAGALTAFVAGGRYVERIAFAVMPLGLAIAVAILVALQKTGGPLVYLLGGWQPPLGVALRADPLSAVMMAITAIVICAVSVYARDDFRTPAGLVEGRAPFSFWILLLAVWGALNAIFVGGDLFTLYVALELLTFAAVPLVCLNGSGETLQAALRYLLFALLGSALYLMGAGLLYGTAGTLDIILLARQIHGQPPALVAIALMTVGLLAKTALFPLHLWLPPAHAGAPPAASAVLSGLVVKGSFFIVVRLWFDAMPGLPGPAGAQLLAALGAAAILFGNIVALRQERLKLLIAYSTLAQIGYLFLMFPLAFDPASAKLRGGSALAGGLLQAISHATAKAAMFMVAGLIYSARGNDRIVELGGVGRVLPISLCAFALSGVSLIGLPPSGAYLAKQLLLQAVVETDQWWWAVAIQVGGILTSAYVVVVLAHALAPAEVPVTHGVRMPRIREAAALALALCSLLLGLVPWQAYLTEAADVAANPLSLTAISTALWPVLGGGVVAILLGRWGGRLAHVRFAGIAAVDKARCAGLALSGVFERVDGALRQWVAAGISLLAVAVVFGAAMLVGR